MHDQYNLGAGGDSTLARKTALVDFLRWPVERRKAFISQQMQGSPNFIKESLLRAA